MTPYILFIIALIVSLSPPNAHARIQRYPGFEETGDARKARYASIASDLDTVVNDPDELPAPGLSRNETIALFVAIMYHESGFAPDIDSANGCYHDSDRNATRCDSNESVCMMQIHFRPGEKRDGYTKEEVKKDRKKCFRVALHLLQDGARACADGTLVSAMSTYATGACASKSGLKNATMKVRTMGALDTVGTFPAR